MGAPAAIRVKGLSQFRRSLKELDSGLPKMVRKSLNEAGEIITDNTAPWVPRRSGRAKGSLKLRSTQTKARVTHGGNRARYVPWLDFGGRRRGRGGGIAVRQRVQSGRYIWRTMGRHSDEVSEALDKALTQLAESSGLAVRSG